MMIIKGAESDETEREKGFLGSPLLFQVIQWIPKTSFYPRKFQSTYRIHRPLTQSTFEERNSLCKKGGKGKGKL